MYIKARGGVAGAKEAFLKLEAKLPSLKKRKFYGVLLGSSLDSEYRACVALRDNDPKVLGLKSWTIPGGKYAKAKMKNWMDKIKLIGPTFKATAKKHEVDEKRPRIEYYERLNKLILYLPIK